MQASLRQKQPNHKKGLVDFGESGHGHADEGWIFSYADMITILMTFFILLLSISNVSPEKYEELKKSIDTKANQKDKPATTAANQTAPSESEKALSELKKLSNDGAPQLAGIPLDSVAKKAAESGGDRQAQLLEGVRILMSAADKRFMAQDIRQISEFEDLKQELEQLSKVSKSATESKKWSPIVNIKIPFDKVFDSSHASASAESSLLIPAKNKTNNLKSDPNTEMSISKNALKLFAAINKKAAQLEIRPALRIEFEPGVAII